MSRMIGLLSMVLGSLLLSAGGPAFGGQTTILVPEPGYVPKVGDRAVLYSLDSGTIPSDLWCATTSQDCRDFLTSLFAEDDESEGTDEPTVEEKIVHLAPRTDVQLLARETVAVQGAKDGPPMKCTYFAIKVLSGAFQGKTLYTLDFHITRLIEPPAGLAVAREGANAAESSAPALAPIPQPIGLETPDTPPSVRGEGQSPETPALPPAARRIELETTDVPPRVGEGTKVATPPAPATPARRIELEIQGASPMPERGTPTLVSEAPAQTPLSPPFVETPAGPSSVGGTAKALEAPAPAPRRIELETPEAPPQPERGTPSTSAGAASPAPATVTSSPATPIGVEPPAAAPDAPPVLPSAPSPATRGEVVTEAALGRARLAVESAPPADVSPAPRVERQVESSPVLPQAPSVLDPLPPVEPSLPLAPSSETKAESREIRGEPSVAMPPTPLSEPGEIRGEPSVASPPTRVLPRPAPGPNPALVSPPPASSRLEDRASVPRFERQTTPRKPRALVSAPATPRSAPEMLAAAKEQDVAGQALEAIVAYRTLERAHPGSTEARIAAVRVKQLTEKLDLAAQERRAAQVMKRARDLETSGNRSLALGYFQQIVKIYPKTPTARQASERIRALGTKNPSPGR